MCETLEDKHGQWNKSSSWVRQPNPLFNDTHPFLQNCSVWSIDYRKNDTACPARMRPDCQVMDHEKYNFTCPFGARGTAWPSQTGKTTEYCECIGLTKRKMPIGHTVYCVCERNLAKTTPPHFHYKYCDDTYLFKKKCVVHWPYDVGRGQSKSTRYFFNCSFVDCHEYSSPDLYLITGFNTTCVNSTVFVPVILSTEATTTTIRTTTSTTTKTTTPTEPTTTTIITTTETSTTPTTPTTPTTLTTSTTPTTPPTPTTSTTLPPNTNFTSPTHRAIYTSTTNTSTKNPIIIDNITSVYSNILVELNAPVLEYAKGMNHGSLFGLMVALGIMKFLIIIGLGGAMKKRFKRYAE